MTSASYHIAPDPAALAVQAADWIVERLQTSSGRFALNLSGGSTPKRLYELLAMPPWRERIDWRRVHLFFGDERYVPHDDPDSNYRMVDEALIRHVPIPPENVFAIPSGPTPDDAARFYEATLRAYYGEAELDPARPLFDVTLLGLGPDGHTASLFPGSASLEETIAWVLPVIGSKPPPQRITLTFPVLNSSAAIAFLATGGEKTDIIRRVHAGDRSLPAARLTPLGELHWFLDAEAARGLDKP